MTPSGSVAISIGRGPAPFREYIAWLRRQDLAAAETYWRRELAGFTAATPLASDRPFRADLPDREVLADQQLGAPFGGRYGCASSPSPRSNG